MVERMKFALLFLSWMWGIAFLGGGMVASLGLIAWPWSSDPLWCISAGIGGALAQIFGAWILTRFDRQPCHPGA